MWNREFGGSDLTDDELVSLDDSIGVARNVFGCVCPCDVAGATRWVRPIDLVLLIGANGSAVHEISRCWGGGA